MTARQRVLRAELERRRTERQGQAADTVLIPASELKPIETRPRKHTR